MVWRRWIRKLYNSGLLTIKARSCKQHSNSDRITAGIWFYEITPNLDFSPCVQGCRPDLVYLIFTCNWAEDKRQQRANPGCSPLEFYIIRYLHNSRKEWAEPCKSEISQLCMLDPLGNGICNWLTGWCLKKTSNKQIKVYSISVTVESEFIIISLFQALVSAHTGLIGF